MTNSKLNCKYSLISQINLVKEVGFCFLFLLLIVLAQPNTYAQEVLRELSVNPELIKLNKEAKQLKSVKATPAFITIPFVDDFSTTRAYPDANLWLDKKVYINTTFQVNPVTIGVATFDALDENGYLYKNASATPFSADTLTSRPFDFGSANLDSMYFSFFYQAGGMGDKPEVGDSLMVEFSNPDKPDSTRWQKVWPNAGEILWAKGGDTINPFVQVMIPVADEYKKNGFQFRFRNKASIDASKSAGKHGNVDHWNIDYVRLNAGRNKGDTVLHDIAFVKPLTTLLKTYQSMPWLEYLPAFRREIKPNIDITFRNNDTIASGNVYKNFKISEITPSGIGQVVTFESLGNQINPNTTQTFSMNLSNPLPQAAGKEAQFDVEAYLDGTKDNRHQNDTIHYRQVFSNYFAYDDGSSEGGYGIIGEGAQDARLAYQFNTYKVDTLTGISFYFNPTEKDTAATFSFQLAVWADNDGSPGEQLYLSPLNDSAVSPKKVLLNQFYNFKLDSGIVVNGPFYVGLVQESDNFLNIGFDKNNNNQQFLFINLNGRWTGSSIAGSLMIRPVLGEMQSGPITATPTIKKKNSFSVYPNPANDFIYITTEIADKKLTANLINLNGKLVLSENVQDYKLDVSTITNGLYILKLSSEKTSYQPVKILIQH